MATVPITLDFDADAAADYLEASDDERRKLQLLMNLRLRELVDRPRPSLTEVMDEIGRKAEARGLTPEILDALISSGCRLPAEPSSLRRAGLALPNG